MIQACNSAGLVWHAACCNPSCSNRWYKSTPTTLRTSVLQNIASPMRENSSTSLYKEDFCFSVNQLYVTHFTTELRPSFSKGVSADWLHSVKMLLLNHNHFEVVLLGMDQTALSAGTFDTKPWLQLLPATVIQITAWTDRFCSFSCSSRKSICIVYKHCILSSLSSKPRLYLWCSSPDPWLCVKIPVSH